MGEGGGVDMVPEQMSIRVGADTAVILTGSRHVDAGNAQHFRVLEDALSQTEDIEPEDMDTVTRLDPIQGLFQRVVEGDRGQGRDLAHTRAVLADGGDSGEIGQ